MPVICASNITTGVSAYAKHAVPVVQIKAFDFSVVQVKYTKK